jgi:hypothetical protein
MVTSIDIETGERRDEADGDSAHYVTEDGVIIEVHENEGALGETTPEREVGDVLWWDEFLADSDDD